MICDGRDIHSKTSSRLPQWATETETPNTCFNLSCLSGSIREVDGVRWHGCPYCSKEFKKPSDLVRHIRIHTHEKPFKCKQCFRAFAVKSTLTAHMKTHTGIKAFECQCCLKCFSTSGSMKVHMRLHTGERQIHSKERLDMKPKWNDPRSTFTAPCWLIPNVTSPGTLYYFIISYILFTFYY